MLMMHRQHGRQRGFSLVEVLVALIVVCVGMLGIAKIQALAYASTGNASARAIAALQAASMAASMRANRTYWALAAAPATISISSGGTISDATLNSTATTATYCLSGVSAPCSPATLAAYDLHSWATALGAVLPGASAAIACPTTPTPINCTITVNWNENAVAVNTNGASVSTALTPSYTLNVEP